MRGDWCQQAAVRQPLPFKPPPRGDKSCPDNCSNIGNCHHGTGRCMCPAGYTGPSCAQPQKRPCTAKHRVNYDRPLKETQSHVDATGHDLNVSNPLWTASRCAGQCDVDIAGCWCPANSKHSHIWPAKGSRYGSPPIKMGRPMMECTPSHDAKGNKLPWGRHAPWDQLFGPKGWCEAERNVKLEYNCACLIDGLDGPLCDQPVEQFCMNQCTGHGTCVWGYCKCDDGWYGEDCSLPRKGLKRDPDPADAVLSARPWLKDFMVQPAAAQEAPPAGATRLRPFIYVYDMDPVYTSRMLQYRIARGACSWREWNIHNNSQPNSNGYSLESLFHELLLQSPHRTLDPEEADFFYVPVYASCLAWPVWAWADYPWWGGTYPRVQHLSNLYREAKLWVQQNFPYWNRRQGRDHIWLFTHDEGACWAPTEIYNTSIILTHWGRLGLNHTSNTAWAADNYTLEDMGGPALQPGGWLRHIQGHACYDPVKDLVVPSYKHPNHYGLSPLLGSPPVARDILLFFRGDVGAHRLPHYSRGIRQKLHKLSVKHNWREKHRIFIGDRFGSELTGDYTELLRRSVFCLVLPGDGYSARAVDAIAHGCLPVVIQDDVDTSFATVVDWSRFSIRVREADVGRIVKIVKDVTPECVVDMQKALAEVWHRFVYASHPHIRKLVRERQHGPLAQIDKANVGQAGAAAGYASHPHPHRGELGPDDAFQTIIQWLHSRINATR